MTASDFNTVIDILCAEDIAAQERNARLLALARIAARTAPTAELRTVARLQMLRLEKAVVA